MRKSCTYEQRRASTLKREDLWRVGPAYKMFLRRKLLSLIRPKESHSALFARRLIINGCVCHPIHLAPACVLVFGQNLTALPLSIPKYGWGGGGGVGSSSRSCSPSASQVSTVRGPCGLNELQVKWCWKKVRQAARQQAEQGSRTRSQWLDFNWEEEEEERR